MFRKILGRSPLFSGVKKIQSHLSFRGGSGHDVCLSDEAFFEIIEDYEWNKLDLLKSQL